MTLWCLSKSPFRDQFSRPVSFGKDTRPICARGLVGRTAGDCSHRGKCPRDGHLHHHHLDPGDGARAALRTRPGGKPDQVAQDSTQERPHLLHERGRKPDATDTTHGGLLAPLDGSPSDPGKGAPETRGVHHPADPPCQNRRQHHRDRNPHPLRLRLCPPGQDPDRPPRSISCSASKPKATGTLTAPPRTAPQARKTLSLIKASDTAKGWPLPKPRGMTGSLSCRSCEPTVLNNPS